MLNKEYFVAHGGVSELMRLASSPTLSIQQAALMAICNLIENQVLTEAVWRAGAASLLSLLSAKDESTQEHVVCTLFGLLEHGPFIAIYQTSHAQ